MTTKTFTQFTAVTALAAGDELVMWNDAAGAARKVTVANFIANSPNGGLAELGATNIFTADQTSRDDVKKTFGTGGDADIWYDGNDLKIDPQVVGTGDILLVPNGGKVGINTPTPGSQLAIKAASASTVGLVVNTAASPTANILDLQNNGSARLTVDWSGKIVTSGNIVADGTVRSPAFGAVRATIADDNVLQITPVTGLTRGILIITNSGSGSVSIQEIASMITFDVPGNRINVISQVASRVQVTTGVLTGESGADAKLTVSVDSGSAKIYVENRLGSSVIVTYMIIS